MDLGFFPISSRMPDFVSKFTLRLPFRRALTKPTPAQISLIATVGMGIGSVFLGIYGYWHLARSLETKRDQKELPHLQILTALSSPYLFQLQAQGILPNPDFPGLTSNGIHWNSSNSSIALLVGDPASGEKKFYLFKLPYVCQKNNSSNSSEAAASTWSSLGSGSPSLLQLLRSLESEKQNESSAVSQCLEIQKRHSPSSPSKKHKSPRFSDPREIRY